MLRNLAVIPSYQSTRDLNVKAQSRWKIGQEREREFKRERERERKQTSPVGFGLQEIRPPNPSIGLRMVRTQLIWDGNTGRLEVTNGSVEKGPVDGRREGVEARGSVEEDLFHVSERVKSRALNNVDHGKGLEFGPKQPRGCDLDGDRTSHRVAHKNHAQHLKVSLEDVDTETLQDLHHVACQSFLGPVDLVHRHGRSVAAQIDRHRGSTIRLDAVLGVQRDEISVEIKDRGPRQRWRWE